jgi:hypothetical protein
VIERIPGRAQAKPYFGEGSYTAHPDLTHANYFNLTKLLAVKPAATAPIVSVTTHKKGE